MYVEDTLAVRPFPAYRGSESYVFVSYAHADDARVYPLLEDLRARDFNIWYDEGIEPGESWREELATAIEDATRVIYFVSSRSVNSRNCIKEINFALSRDVPITLVYLEAVTLPSALEFSLGDEQAIHLSHYEPDTFLDKLTDLLNKSGGSFEAPSPGKAAPTPNRKLLGAVAAFAVVLIVALVMWQRDISDSGASGPLMLAVNPLAYHGQDDNAWIGAALTNLVSDRLADSRHTALVSQTRWTNLRREHQDLSSLHNYARRNGIRYVVSGEILKTPDGAILSMRISDLVAGVDVGARTFEDITPATLGLTAEAIRNAVSETLSLPTVEQKDTLSADFAAANHAAYRAYITGLDFYNSFAYEEAAEAMETALSLDPEFHMARFRLANIQLSQGASELARANLDRIPADAPLSRRERFYVDGLTFMADGNNAEAITLFRAFSQEFPYEVEARQYLAESLWRNFEIESAISTLEDLSTREPENHHVWAAMGYMLMSIERYDDAERALETYAALAPDLPHPWELLGNLALHRMDVPGAQTHFRRALEIEPEFSLALLGDARTNALLGDYQSASSVLRQLVDGADRAPRYRILAAIDLVALQMAEGAYQDVDSTFTTVQALIEAEGSRTALALQQRGLAALYRGDTSAARDLLEEAVDKAPAGGVPTRYLFARGLLEAAVGDLPSLAATIDAVRQYALPPDDPDRTEDKAALYLEGKLLAAQEDWTGAIAKYTAARDTLGYPYRSADLALGEAHAAEGQRQAALSSLTRAITQRDQYMAGDPRLDLEYDRRQALLLANRLACAGNSEAERDQVARLSRTHWPKRPAPVCVPP